MKPVSTQPASIDHPNPQALVLSGCWTARGLGAIDRQFGSLHMGSTRLAAADATRIEALDSAGAWILHRLLLRLKRDGVVVSLRGLRPEFGKLLGVVAQHDIEQSGKPAPVSPPAPGLLERVGRGTQEAIAQGLDLLSFVGESTLALARCVAQPARLRVRPILFNIQRAGVEALPIVGLLSFLLGIVVAYQGAAQLRQYGANIFVADLIGLSMLREFAPLITAIIIAGRSGSAFAAQIGTMSVTEEIDAMRTLGISPLELLVLPKILALVIVLPLLTVFADLFGVFGGMLMARAQLDVGFGDFLERFVKAISMTDLLIGICKAPVFAIIIAVVGSFQGFRARGGADSVGRQTTRSVVQSIFLVIVADALFSVAFSALDL